MNCRVSWTKSAGNEAIMMFLEQFLIGNLWNACLICVMLGLKWLLRNRLSLRSVITPKWDMACVTTREIRWTAGICDFQCFQQYCCNCCGNRMASGYNRTDHQSWKQPFCFCRFDNLVGRCSGTDRCVLGRKLAASYSQAICNGPIPSNPQAV